MGKIRGKITLAGVLIFVVWAIAAFMPFIGMSSSQDTMTFVEFAFNLELSNDVCADYAFTLLGMLVSIFSILWYAKSLGMAPSLICLAASIFSYLRYRAFTTVIFKNTYDNFLSRKYGYYGFQKFRSATVLMYCEQLLIVVAGIAVLFSLYSLIRYDLTAPKEEEEDDIFRCACTNCGKPINRYQPFCANCGFPTKKVCLSCGEKVSPEANFCMKCGKSLLLTNEEVKTNDVSK